MDELHMALQVAVDHEHLVAARVGTGPLADLLVVLLYVLLWGTVTLSAQLGLMAPAAAPGPCSAPWKERPPHEHRQAASAASPSCHRPLGTQPCSPGGDTCRWWAAPPCNRARAWSCRPGSEPRPPASPLAAQLGLPAGLRSWLLPQFWFFRLLGFFAFTLLTRDPERKKKRRNQMQEHF